MLFDGPFVLCFSTLVSSLVASVLARLVWAGASEYVFSLDFGTTDYNLESFVLKKPSISFQNVLHKAFASLHAICYKISWTKGY